MAQLNNLRVNEVSELRNDASDFAVSADLLNGVFTEMSEMVTATSGVWRGDAAEKYRSQFQQLGDDMAELVKYVNRYAEKLSEIADNYDASEGNNASTASSLKVQIV